MYLNDTKIDDGLGMQDSSKFAEKDYEVLYKSISKSIILLLRDVFHHL